MSPEEMLRLAKEGKTQAIAAMINKSLEPKEITVKISNNNGCLIIIAESEAIPDQDALVGFLKSGINKLKPANILQVVIRGKAVGQTTNSWQVSFNLGSSEPKAPINQSKVSAATNAASSTQALSKSQALISNSASQPKSVKSLVNFANTRNGERVLIASSTFLMTSLLWFGVGYSNSTKHDPNIASSPSTSNLTAVTTPSESASTPAPQIASPPAALTEDEKATKFMTTYLEKIVSGEDGDSFFCDQKSASKFFAPRNFQILKVKMYDTVGQAMVRLDSSNKGGTQITNNWQFYLKKGKPQYAALIGV